MKNLVAIIIAVVVVGIMIAAIIPMWVSTAGMELSGAGLAAVILMVVGCFAVGGGLMFLIFFSARRGYDDAAHHGAISERDRSAGR